MTTIDDARDFVRTTPLSGLAQLALVEHVGFEGCNLLEIGCGTLHFAKALLASHRHGIAYSGIDPNEWLRDAARAHDPVLDRLCVEHGAAFSSRQDFDGRAAFGHPFDLVFAHSVLSHASHGELAQFMAKAAEALWPGGMLIASLNLAIGGHATMGDQWAYPHGVTVDTGELGRALAVNDLVLSEPGGHVLRELYMSWCPDETHDWIVARKWKR